MKNGSAGKTSHVISGKEPWREKSITKPPAQRDKVVAGVKELIVSGQYGPGDRLPTRDDLETLFQVSRPTIQSAFDLLGLEGFVEPRGRGGTYVTDQPPHLFQLQLVLPPYEQGHLQSHSRYFQTMQDLVGEVAEDAGFRCSVSYGLDPGSDLHAYNMLVDDVQQHRVAGLVFGSMPFISSDSPVISLPRVARVSLAINQCDAYPVIMVDWKSLFRLCADYLVEQKCKRVALLTCWTLEDNSQIGEFRSLLAARGIESPDYWVQHMAHTSASAAANVAHLIFEKSLGDTPDALVVLDDNLYPAACEGLHRAGVPDEGGPIFVAHANFPAAHSPAKNVRRLGFDLRESLSIAMERIRAQIQGAAFPSVTSQSAIFGDQI